MSKIKSLACIKYTYVIVFYLLIIKYIEEKYLIQEKS